MTYQIRSTSSSNTEKIGEQLGKLIKGAIVIEMRSDLGGGKTTFVRGLVRGLGGTDKVASPTFTINKIYKAKGLEVHHFDFYRLSEPGLMSEQLEESLQNSRVVTIVEWSSIVQDVLPVSRLIVELKPIKNSVDERLISITYPETRAGLIRKLETAVIDLEP